MEYRLCVALTTGTVTALDAEFVLDLRKWRWYRIDRGTGNKIQCFVNVTDSYGGQYQYGFLDTGYMERLEYGNTFDGTAITSTLRTGLFAMEEGDYLTETSLVAVVPVLAAKTTTTANATLTHKINSYATGTDYTIDPTHASYDLAYPVKVANSAPGIFHDIQMTMETNNETIGFEPLIVGLFWLPIRDHDYE
jgi:hypothetical protein